MTKSPNEVDRHVGGRVRLRRMLIGMSQEKLGEALGITFQQVQKYEKGVNRISASRLQQISQSLGVTIDYLYQGVVAKEAEPGMTEGPPPVYDSELLTADGLRLLHAFQRIQKPKVRRRLLDLATALSSGPGEGERSD